MIQVYLGHDRAGIREELCEDVRVRQTVPYRKWHGPEFASQPYIFEKAGLEPPSKQYNICGNPNCRCKADPPVKHGPYYQISFTRHGKSSSQFVREEDLAEVQQQLENYRQLRQLVDEWITLSAELSSLRLREKRKTTQNELKRSKLQIPR